MRLSVCEAPVVLTAGDAGWSRIVELSRNDRPDIFLLNEMPFGKWVSVGRAPDAAVLRESMSVHDEGVEHLAELSATTVLGSHPVFSGSVAVNEAFVWNENDGLTPAHHKQFFPNEGGFYEARWFARGPTRFNVMDAGGVRVGFLICTDVMFNEWARHYGRNDAQLLAVPRATPAGSVERWRTMCRAAAIVSGCYVASSNRAGLDESGLRFSGNGWIIDPIGDVIAETSPEEPVAGAELDLDLVEKAQGEYPCYVQELPQESSLENM